MTQNVSHIEQLCTDKGMKMTEQRRVIARVLSDATDHPDVEEARISIATVYRTMRLFEEADIVKRHEFGDGRARYEETPTTHHDHLIDMRSGVVTEFRNDDIERLQKEVAAAHGYKLVGHRLELYVVPLDKEKETET